MIKILAGEFRSRIIETPPDNATTRPYVGRVRESVFGMLQGWFEDASVLDLFAGVGTVGLEAVSRGARSVLMVEQNKKIYGLLRDNVRTLDCQDRAITMLGDALGGACLARAERPVDLVFMDPPYAMVVDELSRGRILTQAARCREIMGDSGFLILRSPLGPDKLETELPGFDGPEAHRYGRDMWVLLWSPAADPGGRSPAEMPTKDSNASSLD